MYQLTIVTWNIVRRVIFGAKPAPNPSPMVLINPKRRMVPVATLTLAAIIALSGSQQSNMSPRAAHTMQGLTVVIGVTNQNYARVTSIIENLPKKGRRTSQPVQRIMTSCVMAHSKMLSRKTAFPVATMPAAIGTAAWKSVTTVLLLREIIIILMLMIITHCLSLNSHWLINRFGNILA